MSKRIIRLTEGDLHRIVRESVERVLMEANDYNSKFKKIVAACCAKGMSPEEAVEHAKNWMAKNAAINDMEKEVNVSKNKHRIEKFHPDMDLQRYRERDEFFRKTPDSKLNKVDRSILDFRPTYGDDMLSVDY